MKIRGDTFWLLVILFVAFIIRIYNFSFPFFTADEARVAARGYSLASSGKDELGRPFPLIFNSQDDYQLPVVSYITAAGVKLFGKNDLGARMPFILISLVIVIIVYKVSKILIPKKEFQLLSAFIIAFSPSLIFISKVPNETILLIFSFILLFYLLTKEKVNLLSLFIVMVFSLATSKVSWWTLLPFTIFTLVFFQTNQQKRIKLNTIIMAVFLTGAALALFLRVPQATRSLLENDFTIFKDTSITVAVNQLRGQGLEAGWPNYLEKIIFNKSQFITVGIINWLDDLSPAILFSQFDSKGIRGFNSMGEFPAAALLSFAVGLVFIVSKGNRKLKALVAYSLVLTFPIFFSFPGGRQSINLLILPFMAFIIGAGLVWGNRLLKYAVLFLIAFEVLINISYFSPEVKNANSLRPIWVKEIVQMSYDLSVNNKVAISDNLVSDIVPFLGWLSPIPASEDYKDIYFPYKFRQTELPNIKIIGTEDIFYFCAQDPPTYIMVSRRDLEKIQRWLNIDTPKTIQKIYYDNLDKKIAYLLKPTICVK